MLIIIMYSALKIFSERHSSAQPGVDSTDSTTEHDTIMDQIQELLKEIQSLEKKSKEEVITSEREEYVRKTRQMVESSPTVRQAQDSSRDSYHGPSDDVCFSDLTRRKEDDCKVVDFQETATSNVGANGFYGDMLSELLPTVSIVELRSRLNTLRDTTLANLTIL